MTEPTSEQQQNHHLKTSDAPSSSSSSSSSGGRRSSGASAEHPPSSGRAGSPESAARGRQSGRKVQWAKAENGTGPAVVVGNNNNNNNHNKNINNSDSKLWQQTMRGGQQADVCPALTAGNSLPACPVVVAAQHCQGPAVTDASSAEGGNYLVAHGNSGDGPPEETWSRGQGDSGIHVDVDPAAGGLGSGSDTAAAAARRGRKKHRRRASKKKRYWKPYFNLSWEEKRAMDERETARASRVRAEMFAKGLPVAPYNTTQFLMEEHDREEPDLNTETGGGGVGAAARRFLYPEDSASEGEDLMDNYEDYGGDGGNSCGPGDGIGRPGNAAGGEFLQRDFSETYERYHVETLQNMSKQELVQEYLELEKCMSRLEEENNRLLRGAVEPPPGATATDSPPGLAAMARVRELEGELERLRALNSELRNQPNRAERSGPVGGH